jgi:glycine/D-amino acid oxidase-like deaminating enzyme
MLSFWERESFLRYDVIVIGSGIIGLSTAIAAKRRRPDCSVLVLERGLFPTGASTKNAGFACFGSLTEIVADIAMNGEEATLAIVEKRWRGLALLRSMLGDEAIGYSEHGGHELLFEDDLNAVESIPPVNQLLRQIFGRDVFEQRDDLIADYGFNRRSVRGLILNPLEGEIDTGRMMRSLRSLAAALGVEILTGAEVVDVTEYNFRASVSVRHPVFDGQVSFVASHVAICTNAMIRSLLPDVIVKPGRGQVLITQPVEGLRWKGTFHFDEGYYYFRNVGNRVLFGGGRNLAFEQEQTAEFAYNEEILDRLEEILREVILPGQPFEIDSIWTGIMGFTAEKCPIVRRVSDQIVVGFGCNGMGVAIGSLIGEETAAAMLGEF